MIEPWPGTLPMTDDSQPTEEPRTIVELIRAARKAIEEDTSHHRPDLYVGSQEVINALFCLDRLSNQKWSDNA